MDFNIDEIPNIEGVTFLKLDNENSRSGDGTISSSCETQVGSRRIKGSVYVDICVFYTNECPSQHHEFIMETKTKYQRRKVWIWWNRKADVLTLDSSFGVETQTTVLIDLASSQTGLNQGYIGAITPAQNYCEPKEQFCTQDLIGLHTAVHQGDNFDYECGCFIAGGDCF